MVAISIDKYLAIMYPMRLRMPKAQAKIIILVIWSAALMTSLPTALLSSLTSASEPVVTTGSVAASQAENNPPIETPATNQQSTLQSTFTLTQETLTANKSANPQPSAQTASITSVAATNFSIGLNDIVKLDEYKNQTLTTPTSPLAQLEQRPFCQESWNFWPPGKYYYSMALMILQFVIPLFVLVITYSRIVIVVWGKRIPGEEDNARDTRMARSKRKVNSSKCSCCCFPKANKF